MMRVKYTIATLIVVQVVILMTIITKGLLNTLEEHHHQHLIHIGLLKIEYANHVDANGMFNIEWVINNVMEIF